MSRKTTEVNSETIGKGKVGSLDEIGKEPIEQVSENDFVKAMDLEQFMNQKLEVYIQAGGNTGGMGGSLPVVTPAVNGVNQPIPCKQWVLVKRKYVEALARGTYTEYEQVFPDASRMDRYKMAERKAHSYPFSVRNDPHPNGAEWLSSILAAA